MTQRITVFLTVLIVALSGATAWSAEVRLDLYGGVAMTEDNSVSAALPLSSEATTQGVNFEERQSIGIRLRIFSETAPIIGFGQDFSYYVAQGTGTDIDVFTVSPMLMLRIPLTADSEYPGGMIQPYAGIGPTFSILTGTFDLQPNLSRRINDTTFEVGYQALAGLLINLNPQLAIFGEYKYTHMTPDFRDDGLCALFCVTSEKAKVRLDSHHFLVGLSVRF